MAVTVFGGGAVQTAYVSFTPLDITANSITLVWPTSYFDVPSVVDGIHYDVLAASFTVNNGVLNDHTITLPDATQSSVGSNFIVTNIGASSFRLLKSNGNELLVLPNGPNNPITGTATLVAGTVIVNTNAVVAGSNIQATRNTPAGGLGNISVPSGSIIPNTSFVINSSDNTETSTVDWFISNPLSYNSFWVQLIDNTTPEGIWQFVQFGAGTSQAQASALAGNGLVALGGLLNTNIVVEPILNSPYQVLGADRAKLLLWQAGAGAMILPIIANVPAGFYISVNNEGGGVLVISGNVNIDNHASISVSPGQSLSIISDGNKWWSLGFGQNIASSNFAPGSAIAPSITFTSDITTGIYYYNTAFPPVTPPGIGFSVNSSQIANLNASGLYMNAGNDITVQDSTGVAESKLQSNASYARLTWSNTGLINLPTLDITGTDTESTLTLGPFETFKIEQNDLIVAFTYGLNNFLIVNDTTAVFPIPVLFNQTVTLNGTLISNNTATFNGSSNFNAAVTLSALAPIVCNGTANFNASVTLGVASPLVCNGTANFNGAVTLGIAAPLVCNGSVTFNGAITLATPLSIANGGTGQNNQADAIKALLPAAPPIGSMIYYDNTNNWIVVSPGAIGNTLTLVDDGMGNPVPKWT